MLLRNENQSIIIEYLIDFPFSTAKEVINCVKASNPKLTFQSIYLCLKKLERENIIYKYNKLYNLSNQFLKYIKNLYIKTNEFKYNKFDTEFFRHLMNKNSKITIKTSNIADSHFTGINMRLAAISLKPNIEHFTILKHYSTFLLEEKLIKSKNYNNKQKENLCTSLLENKYNVYGNTKIDKKVTDIMKVKNYKLVKRKPSNLDNTEYVIADDIIISAKYGNCYEKFTRYLSEKDINHFPSDSYFRFIKYEPINAILSIERNKEKAANIIKDYFI